MNQTLTTSEQSCCENRSESRRTFRPAADVLTTPKGVVLRVDLPGAKETDVDVTVDADILTIRAQVDPPADDGLTPLMTEYRIGDYERKFRISKDVERESIDATFRNGVLTLNLIRTPLPGPAKVKVKGA
jgi:HSP20 family molecular chaperone IbpA